MTTKTHSLLAALLLSLLSLLMAASARCAELPAEIPVFVVGEPDAHGQPAHTQPLIPKIIQMVAAESGLHLVVRPLPWRRAQMQAENGEGLLYGASDTPERLQIFQFTKPLGTVNQWLVSTEQAPLPFHRWEDLRNKVISTMPGAKYGAEFEAHRNQLFSVEQDATTLASQLKMLRAGRVDAVIAASYLGAAPLEAKLNCQFPDGPRLLVAGGPIEIAPITFAAAKASPLNRIVPTMNAAIERLVKAHSLQKLLGATPPVGECAHG